jgi:hypothetical protein
MAARKTRGTTDAPWDAGVRGKIQTSMLLNRLQGFALSEQNAGDLDGNRIKAIEILLGKVLPNLASVESFNQTEISVISAEPLTPEAWAEAHGADVVETKQ